MDTTAILTLLLAIPLAILANLFTPSIKNGLALLSRKLIAQRIKVLQSELDKLDAPASIESVLEILKRLCVIAALVSSGLGVLTIGMVYQFRTRHQLSSGQGRYVQTGDYLDPVHDLIMSVAFGFFWLAVFFSFNTVFEVIKRKTAKHREKLEQQITSFKLKLESRN